MPRERITEATQTTTKVKFRGKDDDHRNILTLIKAFFGLFVGKVSLRQLFLGDADVDISRTKNVTRTIEREWDGPMGLPRENLEDQLRQDVKATLGRNASNAEAKLLEAGKPVDSGMLGTPNERTRARHELAKEIERLQSLGYKIELDDPSDKDTHNDNGPA